MKVTIIPDIHESTQKFPFYQKEIDNSDKVVFLGDYFDCFGTTETTLVETCQFLNKLPSKCTMLFGNHDLPYFNHFAFDGKDFGWSLHRQGIVNQYLDLERFKSYKMYEWVGDFLLTHAGLNYFNVHPIKGPKETLKELDNLNTLSDRHPLLQRGRARGGISNRPGITWTDWRHEFCLYRELKQIVGHTPLPHYEIKFSDVENPNYNLDVPYKVLVGQIDLGNPNPQLEVKVITN